MNPTAPTTQQTPAQQPIPQAPAAPQPMQPANPIPPAPEHHKSKTGLLIAVLIVAVVLLVGLYFVRTSKPKEVTVTTPQVITQPTERKFAD